MRAYRDPTADLAIGRTDKKLIYMTELAIKLRTEKCDPKWAKSKEQQFVGIFARLLEDPIEELQKWLSKRKPMAIKRS